MFTNDKMGSMVSYGRGTPPVRTEIREDGYYWMYPIHSKKGGNSKAKGPFMTRKEAELDELKRYSK